MNVTLALAWFVVTVNIVTAVYFVHNWCTHLDGTARPIRTNIQGTLVNSHMPMISAALLNLWFFRLNALSDDIGDVSHPPLCSPWSLDSLYAGKTPQSLSVVLRATRHFGGPECSLQVIWRDTKCQVVQCAMSATRRKTGFRRHHSQKTGNELLCCFLGQTGMCLALRKAVHNYGNCSDLREHSLRIFPRRGPLHSHVTCWTRIINCIDLSKRVSRIKPLANGRYECLITHFFTYSIWLL